MEAVKEKYPDAFRRVIDEKGREVLFVGVNEPSGRYTEEMGGRVILSQEGAYVVGVGDRLYHKGVVDEIDAAALLDELAKQGDKFGLVPIRVAIKEEFRERFPLFKKYGPGAFEASLPVRRLDLRENPIERERLKGLLQGADEAGKKERRWAAQKQETAGVDKVIEDLV